MSSSSSTNATTASTMYQWWTSLFQSLWRALGLQGKKGRLVVLGLDNAGKTSLLHRIKTGGDIRTFPPTDRPHSIDSVMVYSGITFQAWDLGGHEAVRHLWQDYILLSSEQDKKIAILFVIDASDSHRLEEAGYELDALIGEGLVADIPIAILLNKCDLVEEALSTDEICTRIQFHDLQRMQGEDKIALFRISVLRGEGYHAAFRWIATFL